MGRVVITGAGGFLGHELVRALLAGGHEVVAVDRYVTAESLEAVPSGAHVVAGDVGDPRVLAAALPGASAVVHLAAHSDDASCDADPVRSAATNVGACGPLAEVAGHHGVRRLVLASTAAVYAGCGHGPVDESSRPAPLSAYAEQKLLAEGLLTDAARVSGTAVVAARLGSLWGRGSRPRFDLVVNRMVRDAVTTGRIVVHGDGRQRRPFLHVTAAASALARLAVDEQPAPALIDLGRAEDVLSVAALARRVAEAVGADATPVAVLHEGDGDPRSYAPRFALAEGLGLVPPTAWGPRLADVAHHVRSGEVGNGRQHRFTARVGTGAPAHAGGTPVREVPLPFATPLLGPEEESALLEVVRSGWLTSGPRARELGAAVAARAGAPYGVAVTSCTAALHVALAALGVGPGDEVVTSPITYPATANVVRHLGARVVFADVDPGTLALDPASVAARTTPSTKAVVPVHMAGQPVDLAALWDVAEQRGVAVVEDAAHAFGATWQGLPVGGSPRSAAVCFSFYPTKNLTTMEGGAVVTHDAALAERVRLLSNHGVDADAWAREGDDGAGWPHWECVEPGWKYLLPDGQAAVGLAQLHRFDGFLERRRAIARRYRASLGGLPGLTPLAEREGARSAWHLFVLVVDEEALGLTRDEVLLALRAEGIGAGVHFRSLTDQVAYRPRPGQADPAPRATEVGRRLLSLPLYPAMSDDDVADVVTAVRRIALWGDGHRRPPVPAVVAPPARSRPRPRVGSGQGA